MRKNIKVTMSKTARRFNHERLRP